jgi:hypothetical protein
MATRQPGSPLALNGGVSPTLPLIVCGFCALGGEELLRSRPRPERVAPNKPNLWGLWAENEGRLKNKANLAGRSRRGQGPGSGDSRYAIRGVQDARPAIRVDRMPNKANLPLWATWRATPVRPGRPRLGIWDWGFAGGGRGASVDEMSNKPNLPFLATSRFALGEAGHRDQGSGIRDTRCQKRDTRQPCGQNSKQTQSGAAGPAAELMMDEGLLMIGDKAIGTPGPCSPSDRRAKENQSGRHGRRTGDVDIPGWRW